MILDGRTIANHILEDLTKRVTYLEERFTLQPHLAVVKMGDDPSTTSYIRQKEKMGKQIGALVSVYQCPTNVTEPKLLQTLDFLQNKGDIQGIILQLPMPDQIDTSKLLMGIHPDKDVDGFKPHSLFIVPIAKATLKLLEVPYLKEQSQTKLTFNEWLKSKKIVVIGKGKTGGQPIIELLRQHGANVSVVDSTTPNPQDITSSADILISAVGKRGVVTKEMLKKDAILLGVGMSMDSKGNFTGDYDEEDIKDQAGWYTPIPGGVGPVNVACLMENLVIAAENSVKN